MPELPPPPPPPMSIGEALVDLARRRRPPWLTSRAAAMVVVGAGAIVVALIALGWTPSPSTRPEIVLPQVGTPGDPSLDAAVSPAEGPGGGGSGGVVAVHAAGAFARPGLYELPDGARVAQLVEVAGGPAEGAILDSLNLAAKLSDGERVYLPREGEAIPAGAAGASGSAEGAAAGGIVDLNTASLDQLDSLPGVGPSTAQAIVDYRQERGRFRSVEELLEVRGIGEARLAALRKRVRV